MFVREKGKNIDYVALCNVYEKPMKFIEQISKLIHISLRKSEIGLGFTLGSEEPINKEDNYTYVRKILDFSPAKYDGRLQVGDRILNINNVDVCSMSQTAIVKLIRSFPIGDLISITVSRSFMVEDEVDHVISVPCSPNCQITTDITPKMEIFHFIITITNDIGKISHCQESAGVLGISVECRATEMNSSSYTLQDIALCNQAKMNTSKDFLKKFFVKSILRNGSAYQDGRLKVNDEILAVQGIDVQNGKIYILDPLLDIYGDIFHFNLAAVFLKNLEKLNKLCEFREMFEVNSENPLYTLKSLIKEAGDMYSSISIVILRTMATMPENGLFVDTEIIQKTYKNSKKKINELCRIENIFELNPDYRHHYGDGDKIRERDESQEEELNGWSRHQVGESGNSLENSSCVQNECGKNLVQWNVLGKEELYSYFRKEEENSESEHCSRDNDNGGICGDEPRDLLLEGIDKSIIDLLTNQE